MKYVLLYESAENVAEKAPAQAPAAIFTTREAAEEFAKNDPFVVNGVVGSWEAREWDEAVDP